METKSSLISNAFISYSHPLMLYVSKRIANDEEAADIVQDVFERLMTYDVVSADTLKSLCFTIANNIVIDHLRRHYKRREVYEYAYRLMSKSDTVTPMQIVACHDIEEKERTIMHSLTPSVARVYEMTQIEEMTIDEIAKTLNISRRTVECHQHKGRKLMRQHLQRII